MGGITAGSPVLPGAGALRLSDEVRGRHCVYYAKYVSFGHNRDAWVRDTICFLEAVVRGAGNQVYRRAERAGHYGNERLLWFRPHRAPVDGQL